MREQTEVIKDLEEDKATLMMMDDGKRVTDFVTMHESIKFYGPQRPPTLMVIKPD